MLDVRTIMSRDGVTVSNVACQHRQGVGEIEEYTGAHSLIFVRRGCFSCTIDGLRVTLDPTVAYCINPGQEQRYEHPLPDGDDCTVLGLADDLLGQLAGAGDALPSGPSPTPPAIDLEHRLLLRALRLGGDQHEVFERALFLIVETITGWRSAGVLQAQGRTRSHRALVNAARESLAVNPDQSLAELARTLTISPYHLSRVFRAATGHTIARHRVRLRARRAIERMAGGERELARLAADVGFSDQSYMSRVLRAETGSTPAGLRDALA
jgi:AraC-like DNA-binding protein